MISGKGRGGPGRPGPELGGGRRTVSKKTFFSALRGSVWSRLGSSKNI